MILLLRYSFYLVEPKNFPFLRGNTGREVEPTLNNFVSAKLVWTAKFRPCHTSRMGMMKNHNWVDV